MSEITERYLIRAAAHSAAPEDLKLGQHWTQGVQDEDVAAVIYAMEALEIPLGRRRTGRWTMPTEVPHDVLPDIDVDIVISEMIRTGLVREWRAQGRYALTLARVHLRDPENRSQTICHDPVEGMDEGRVRIVSDMTLVDCLTCERAALPVRHLRAL